MKKRLCVVLMSALMLVGLGSSLAPAKAATPVPTSANVAAPACLKLYVINWGFCWYGMH